MSEKIVVFDTTLRDGEQSAGVCFQPRDKLEIAAALEAAGVDVIEAGFPGASPGEAAAVAAVAREVRNAVVCGLARAVPADVEAAAAALEPAARSRIHVFVNASDVQLAHQLRRSRAEVVAMAARSVALARRHCDEVEFSPMDATRADPEFVVEIAAAALAAGADTLNLPDTVGYARPEQVAALCETLRRRLPELTSATLSFHGQDDLGLATANALAAVAAGARQVELAVNGIGERAGNTSFEEVVMALRVHGEALGVHTDVDPRGLWALSRLVEERSGLAVASNKAIVGRNAFRHASGIHQDGILKWRESYELLDPREIGHPHGSEIVLGKLSGRAGVAARLRRLGWEGTDAALERAFERFQSLADRQGEVDDAALLRILEETDQSGSGSRGGRTAATRTCQAAR